MEKRLFLAVGLSLIVVWFWSASTPKPPKRESAETAHASKTGLTGNETKIITPPAIISKPLVQAPVIVEKIKERHESVESDKLIVEFSNIGAALQKVTIKEYDAALPIQHLDSISGYEKLPFILDIINDNIIKYSYEDELFKIVRSFTVREGTYNIESSFEIYNKSNMSKLINFEAGGYVVEMSNLNDKENKPSHEMQRDKALFEYVVSSENGIHRKANAFKFAGKEEKGARGRVFWTGFRDRYFCALIRPQYDTIGYNISLVDENALKVSSESQDITIQPQETRKFESLIYVGPEKLSVLKEFGMGFEKIKKYYRFGLFDGAAKIIASMMHWVHKYVPNWGASIIIISVIIYFSMYPLTLKGMLSMRKMQTLQPLIAELKEKHKDNPQKMNKEMMEIYKENKVNPLGGCLPMLLQMPVFIGLYQVLWRSVSFKGADFLWIKDLSQPDRLFILPFSLPFLGNEFNLLPVLMIGVMYVQQKLSTKNIVITDKSQAAQQKMMTTIMPIFIGVIFYKFASGLTLYFTMFYIFSTLTQLKMSKVKAGA